jgi:oligoendopeptidase F
MEPPRHSFQSLDDDGQEIGWDDYRLIKRRQSLEEQRETLLKAEKRWAQRRERQTANKDSDETSLQDLLKLMTSLETIEIQKWRILEYNGLKFDT